LRAELAARPISAILAVGRASIELIDF